MYGTTMKNYSSNKALRLQKENKIKKSPRKEEQYTTRYMKIKNDKRNAMETEEKATPVSQGNEFSRKEFPVVSVIFTAIATMLILLIGTGIIG